MSNKIDSTFIAKLSARLERRGLNTKRKMPTSQDYDILYSCLQDIGYSVSSAVGAIGTGMRAKAPNYEALGINRKAGPPTEEDIQRYYEVTAGGELTSDGFVCPVLLSDNDLLPDRYKVHSFRSLATMASKYLGRANDDNHSFNSQEAAGRLIDVFVGTDPDTEMHPDYPTDVLKLVDPLNPYEGSYSAICGYMAFPKESEEAISRVKTALIHDVSIAFVPEVTICSICAKAMQSIWFFTFCEDHGFPGDVNEADGKPVVGIYASCSDVRTFGHVSDGAARRARYVLDYTAKLPS